MNGLLKWMSIGLPLILVGAILLPFLATSRAAGVKPAQLSAELRGHDNRQPIFRERYRGPVFFLLTAQQDKIKIFQEWCSWGYFTRWYSARQIGGKAKDYVIKRRSRGWTKNFPATHELKKGQFIINSTDLCDGSWLVEPALPKKDLQLKLTGHFEIKPDKESDKQKVWTGKLSTKSIEIIVGPECAAKLNKK
jgi:hypothetical protein